MRSTTPPLYYKRPEGVPLPYYTAAGGQRNVPPSLHVPSAATAAANTTASICGPTTSGVGGRVGSMEQTAYAFPTAAAPNAFPSVPSVTNPFSQMNPSRQTSLVNENPAELLQQSAARWSTTANQSTKALSALEAEEASLLLEEQAMKARLAELQLTRQRQSEEQLEISRGWAVLLDREERYFTEPLLDLSDEIMAREHQCALLQDQLQQAEAHLETLVTEHEQYNSVMEEKQNFETEMRRVREGFMAIERRRKNCRLRAELLFDAESKRAVRALGHVRDLDARLKEMSSSGPLAEMRPAPPSRSASRGITFAQKSIILDVGPHTKEEECDEEEDGEVAGLTQRVGGSSVCLQDDDDDDDAGGISGQSVAYSLNIPVRQRAKVPTA